MSILQKYNDVMGKKFLSFDKIIDTLTLNTMESKNFETLIKVADRNNPKTELNGVLVDLKEGKFVATDTRRFSIMDIPKYTSKSSEPFTLAKEELYRLKKISEITLGYLDGKKVAKATHAKGVSRVEVIGKEYPPYQRIIPLSFKRVFTIKLNKALNTYIVDKKSMAHPNKAKLKKDNSSSLILVGGKDKISIFHYVNEYYQDGELIRIDKGWEYSDELKKYAKKHLASEAVKIGEVKTKGDLVGVKFPINKRYFDTAIAKGKESKLYWNSSTLPLMIETDGLKSIVMPLIMERLERVSFEDTTLDSIETVTLTDLKPLKSADPTEAQKKAENYKKHKIIFKKKLITIENIAGSVRSNVDSDGKRWTTIMKDHYGYVNGTLGADGDHMDVFINSEANNREIENNKAYAIIQNDIVTGKFDEHKLVLGAISKAHAKAIYLRNYSKDFKGFGSVLEIDELSKWLDSETKRNKK